MFSVRVEYVILIVAIDFPCIEIYTMIYATTQRAKEDFYCLDIKIHK